MELPHEFKLPSECQLPSFADIFERRLRKAEMEWPACDPTTTWTTDEVGDQLAEIYIKVTRGEPIIQGDLEMRFQLDRLIEFVSELRNVFGIKVAEEDIGTFTLIKVYQLICNRLGSRLIISEAEVLLPENKTWTRQEVEAEVKRLFMEVAGRRVKKVSVMIRNKFDPDRRRNFVTALRNLFRVKIVDQNIANIFTVAEVIETVCKLLGRRLVT